MPINKVAKLFISTQARITDFMCSLQVTNLNEIELEWLTNHFGHSIIVHKDFYIYQTAAIELGHVAKMLIRVDKGEAQQGWRRSVQVR